MKGPEDAEDRFSHDKSRVKLYDVVIVYIYGQCFVSTMAEEFVIRCMGRSIEGQGVLTPPLKIKIYYIFYKKCWYGSLKKQLDQIAF